MKNDKSKFNYLKLNSIPENLKKQISVQKEAAKKYQKFKKSASQPAYFLDKSRLKKISQIYRTASLEKLSKNYSLNRSKSLHNNVTPEKKVSASNNNSFKKQSGVNTLNINKAFDTNEKTRRLRLDKTFQNQNSHTLETPTQTATKFFTTQVDRLQQITNMNTEKAFTAQYDYFFRTLKQECFNRKGYSSDIKTLVSKFCYLMQLCQDRKIMIREREIKDKYSKVEIDYATVNTELKKKSFKLELLIKEIDQLKLHNMKIAKQLCDLKEEKRVSFGSQKSITNKKKQLQISEVYGMKMFGHQAQLTTPIYQYKFNNSSSSQESFNQFNNKNNESQSKVQKVFTNYNNNNKNEKIAVPQQPQAKIVPNQRLEMIKKIRDLEKKQKDLVKTLLVLKSDGVDVQRAFSEVASGKIDDNNLSASDLDLRKQHMPSYIKKIKNKDSYQADSSIVESIEGLTVRYFEGQPSQEYVFYPIKHEYISKPLDEKLQEKLKLNFDVLYEEYDQPQKTQKTQSSYEEQQSSFSQPPTI